MNSILLRTLQPPRTPSLLAFSDYREAEQANARHSSTTANGALLEYETLELRVHPPNVCARRREVMRGSGGLWLTVAGCL